MRIEEPEVTKRENPGTEAGEIEIKSMDGAERPDVMIRKMGWEDTAEVSCLEAEIFTRPWSRQGFLDAISGKETIFLVAELSGKIVGYCGMYCAADEGEITNVAVAPEARKNGVGGKLLECLFMAAKNAGIRQIILEVRVSNEVAIRLYEKYGFTIQGTRRNFYDEPREDAHVMLRSQ